MKTMGFLLTSIVISSLQVAWGYAVKPVVAEGEVVYLEVKTASCGGEIWQLDHVAVDRASSEILVTISDLSPIEGVNCFSAPAPKIQRRIAIGTFHPGSYSMHVTAFDVTGAVHRQKTFALEVVENNAHYFRRYTGFWYRSAAPGDGFNITATDRGLVFYFLGRDSVGELLWLVSDLIHIPQGHNNPYPYSYPFDVISTVDPQPFGVSIWTVPVFTATAGSMTEPSPSLTQWGELSFPIGTFHGCDNRMDIELTRRDGTVFEFNGLEKLASDSSVEGECVEDQTVLPPFP